MIQSNLHVIKMVKMKPLGISDEIEKNKKKFSYNNIAILVRAIFQTREFEERFLKIGMGYRILVVQNFMKDLKLKIALLLRLIHQEKMTWLLKE